MTEKKKKKKLKSLIRFHCANKIDSYNRGGRKGKKIQRNLQNKSKHKDNKCFSWVTAVRILSLTGSQSAPHLPRMHSNNVLISGPAEEAVQILICSYSSVFLPPMSTAIRTSAFSFVGVVSDLLYIPETQNLPSWSCGFNLQLVQLVGRFWVFFLATLPLGFKYGFISTSACGLSTGVCSWGCLGALGFAPVRARCGGGAFAWVTGVLTAPSIQGSWRLRQEEI